MILLVIGLISLLIAYGLYDDSDTKKKKRETAEANYKISRDYKRYLNELSPINVREYHFIWAIAIGFSLVLMGGVWIIFKILFSFL